MEQDTLAEGRTSLFDSALHRVAAYSWGYDAFQVLAGRSFVSITLRRWLRNVRGLVVDVGGGTGFIKTVLLPGGRHVAIDLDSLKLRGYTTKFVDAQALFGDARRLPVRTGAVSTVMFVAVSHHLTDPELDDAFAEIARVQTADGSLFFFDALLLPDRLASRFMWGRDRGAYPRKAADLIGRLQRRLRIVEQFEVTLRHHYLACRCQSIR
jgi:SAM-dependent methyltransferase